MTADRRRQPTCIEALERAALTPPKTVREIGGFLALFIPCFIDVAHRVADLAGAVFGNGEPGMEGRVQQLLDGLSEHTRKEEEYLRTLQQVALSVKTAAPPEETDSFKKFIKWFVERVLPNLVTAAITLAIAWVVAVNKLIPTP